MLNCVECGAPLGRAAEACEACGARPSPGHLNGKHHETLEEEEDGLHYEPDAPHLHDDEHDDTEHQRERREPSFVARPLADDPTVTSPAFASAPLVVDDEPVRAHFVSRGVAFAIDLVVLGLLDGVLFALATSAVSLAERASGGRVPSAVDLVGALLSAGSMTLALGYFSVLHARCGQTLGKAAMRIRVTDADGAHFGIARSVLRTLGYLPSMLAFGFGFLLTLGPRRLALHDRLTGTVVVRQGGDA